MLLIPLLLCACNEETTITYPEDPAGWAGCPIIPSPAPWFKWRQRYIYDVRVNGQAADRSYMNGYGGYYDDYIDTAGGFVYGANAWLRSIEPETVDATTYVRITGYTADFALDTDGLSWYSKGNGSLRFDGEILIFDYPLVLGKTWSSRTTIRRSIPVEFEAVVAAYIPAGISSSDDIVVAPGRTYTPPIDIAEIPLPLAELGGMTFEELDAVSVADAQIPWPEVRIQAGPRAGLNVTGYYVIQTQLKLAGITVMKQELWKDVRGFVPVYDIHEYPPLVGAATHTIRLARRWTGTRDLSY